MFAAAPRAIAQIENPVYVDDSPSARDAFRRAQDQLEENPAETVRLLQELLDESAYRLLPRTEAARDQYVTVRTRVLQLLDRHDALLERYRSMETAEAERQLRAGRLEELARARSLTEPGLSAMLTLAQWRLERAAFHSALSYLDEVLLHPDLRGEDEAHAWFMFGVAAHYVGNEADSRRADHSLEQFGTRAHPLRERLHALIEQGERPKAPIGQSPFHRTPGTDAVDLSAIVTEPIWSAKLEDTLYRRRYADAAVDRPLVARQLDEAGERGYLMTAAPTIAGDVVYINEGHTVRAFDRFSGSSAWPRNYVDRTSLTIIDHNDFRVQDVNAISVADGMLVTLTGHAYSTMRSSDGRVICLDAETGRLQWSQRLDRLDLREDTSGMYPHSAPIIAEGKVFVLGRRVSPQALASCYLFAFDLVTGEPLWTRHLVSSGSLRRSHRAYGTLVEDDGSLYLASPIGAAARIDAGTGQTRWLHRFPVPITPTTAEQQRRPWELTTPAVMPDHVVVIMPGLRRIAVLDRESGDLLQSHEARDRRTWNTPAYLLTDEKHVFAVGEGISAFHIGEYDAPIWTTENSTDARGAGGDAGMTGLGGSLGLRGRVHVAGDQLLIPKENELAIVESETGLVRQRIPLENPGNPVATEAQIALAGNDRLDVYMSLSRAEDMLRERMAARSDDPEPALSLMRLAIRAQNLNLTLESAHAARDAIARSGSPQLAREARDELFALLVAIEPDDFAPTHGPDVDPDQVHKTEALYETLGQVAEGREQELAYLMAYGDWLAEDTPQRAVEVWQRILDEPELREIVREDDGMYLPADRSVMRRMSDCLTAEVSAALDRRAEEELKSMRNDETAAPEDFFALGNRFPFSEYGLQATLHGVDQLEAAGQIREARAALISQLFVPDRGSLHRKIHDADDADGAREAMILSRLLALLLDSNRTNEALDVLRGAHTAFGNLELAVEREGEQDRRSVKDWLASLGQPEPGIRELPSVGSTRGRGEVFQGSLVPPMAGAVVDASAQQPPSYALLLREGVIERVDVDADAAQVRWEYKLRARGESSSEADGEFPATWLIRADEHEALLWVVPSLAPPYAVMLDAEDGFEHWRTPPIDEILEPRALLPDERELRELMPNDQAVEDDSVLPRVHHDHLVMVARDGRVVAFDLADGRDPKWYLHTGLVLVHHAAVRDGVAVIVGVDAGDDERFLRAAPTMVVIDLVEGQPLNDRPQHLPGGGRGVRWMHLGPFGRLVYATDVGMGAIEVLNRSLHWVNATDAVGDADGWWSDGLRLALRDGTRRLRLVDLDSADVTEPLQGPRRDEDDPMPIDTVVWEDTAWLALYRQRLMRYDHDGRVIGSDIVLDERRYSDLLQASDRLLVLSEMPPAPGPGRLRTSSSEHRYRVYQFAADGMLIETPAQLPPIPQRIERTHLLDDWLFLSMRRGTIAVHMPADERTE